MRRLNELRHVRCANLVDPNQICTKIEQSCHNVNHVPALPPLFKGEALGHARESDLEGTNPPLCNLKHARCVGVQQNFQRGCVGCGFGFQFVCNFRQSLLGFRNTLLQPGGSIRVEFVIGLLTDQGDGDDKIN